MKTLKVKHLSNSKQIYKLTVLLTEKPNEICSPASKLFLAKILAND